MAIATAAQALVLVAALGIFVAATRRLAIGPPTTDAVTAHRSGLLLGFSLAACGGTIMVSLLRLLA